MNHTFLEHLETELDDINLCSYRKLFCLSEITVDALGNDKTLTVFQNRAKCLITY